MTDAYRWNRVVGETGRRLVRCGVAAALASSLGACSFALPSFMGGEGAEETTGSIAKATPEAKISAGLAAEDWRRAKGAIALALDPQGNGRPVKWDNPETKVSGDITPMGSPYVEDDEICRRFTASIEEPSGRLQRFAGRACRVTGDEWTLKQVASAQ